MMSQELLRARKLEIRFCEAARGRALHHRPRLRRSPALPWQSPSSLPSRRCPRHPPPPSPTPNWLPPDQLSPTSRSMRLGRYFLRLSSASRLQRNRLTFRCKSVAFGATYTFDDLSSAQVRRRQRRLPRDENHQVELLHRLQRQKLAWIARTGPFGSSPNRQHKLAR